MNRRIVRAAAAIWGVLMAAQCGLAGVVINAQSVNLQDQKTVDFATMIDATRLRTNMKGQGVDSSMIYLLDGEDYKIIVLDNTKKEYRVMDRKTIENLSQQIGGAMAKMQEQMKNMSPEQRAMMEKMMSKMGNVRGAGTPPPSIDYKEIGSGNVNGRACTKYEGTRSGQKISELCAASPESLNLNKADFAVIEKMTTALEGVMKSMGQLPFMRARGLTLFDKQINGIPVEQTHFESGKPVSKFELKDSTRQNFSDADFSTGDAKQVEMPLGPRTQ